ncbi:MAG: hypothetical protein OEL78_09000 [Hyphomicrobiales bacterium]|nr:hypothetical protein [Hyphomicrobiales bacterium]
MNILQPISGGDRQASTGLWRSENICQFQPSVQAVVELLHFVGFKNDERDAEAIAEASTRPTGPSWSGI